MPQLKSRFLPLALFVAGVLAAGCGEVNNTIDKAQACLEAPKIITELGAELSRLTNDPQAMDKAIDDAAAKLGGVADQAANTTLKEASDKMAGTLTSINVNDVNDAVDAVQKVTSESAAYVEKVAQACS
ncbi:hypothetical protein FAF44_42835 [Nonomuraea sp. MG754425]|uniref:hypothetical protein n=1 Tax=Nonomuraea sp. MG754425 TaxID=2570319 RepID=UPI001F47CB48|nr:hypothetical protein [Nonomuraea sp. MG754425]MCF6475062.1 hypothetical protein [Nonomuraea sp. MG754425]